MRSRLIPSQLNPGRLSSWIAGLVLLAMLGQSLLPTLAYLRSRSDTGLWDEICSIYGARQLRRVDADSGKQPLSGHHADCPLCLHIFNDVILATPALNPLFHLLFLKRIRSAPPTQQAISQRVLIPEARAPPALD